MIFIYWFVYFVNLNKKNLVAYRNQLEKVCPQINFNLIYNLLFTKVSQQFLLYFGTF